MVCVVTSAAVASGWCFAEIATAQSRGSRLLPLLAEPGVTHPLLTEVQHCDITQHPTAVPAALITALRRIDAAGGAGWLRPLHREALRLVIEGPAQLAGIDVQTHLVARLIEDTDTGEVLPLLAFTLAQLADGVGRGGQLSAARYDQLGGVQGALTRQADAALAAAVGLGGRSAEEVIAGLLRLVTVDEQGRPTRWRVHRDELPAAVVAELDVFVTRRLLSTDT